MQLLECRFIRLSLQNVILYPLIVHDPTNKPVTREISSANAPRTRQPDHMVACLLALITTLGPRCRCMCVQLTQREQSDLRKISPHCRPHLTPRPQLGLLHQAGVSSAPQLFRIMPRICCCAIREAYSCLCSS